MEMNMRLIGARTLAEITPDLVDASALRNRAGLAPSDNLYHQTCKHSDLFYFPVKKLMNVLR